MLSAQYEPLSGRYLFTCYEAMDQIESKSKSTSGHKLT